MWWVIEKVVEKHNVTLTQRLHDWTEVVSRYERKHVSYGILRNISDSTFKIVYKVKWLPGDLTDRRYRAMVSGENSFLSTDCGASRRESHRWTTPEERRLRSDTWGATMIGGKSRLSRGAAQWTWNNWSPGLLSLLWFPLRLEVPKNVFL